MTGTVIDLGHPCGGSTKISPYIPLEMWFATIGVAQW
jgi:hypothetical protein